jgi:cell division inhibitor SepF
MTLWKRAMDYLGLGPEDPYDDYDAPQEPEPRQARQPRPQAGWEPEPPRQTRQPRPAAGWEEEPAVRPVSSRTSPSRDLDPVPPRRPATVDPADPSGLTIRQPNRPTPAPAPAVRVQPVPSGEPYTLRPRRFDQAQEVADKFKEGQPVIMNLESADREVSRRLIDFASGLCYALNGSMEKVATGVYLLKPSGRPAYEDGFVD